MRKIALFFHSFRKQLIIGAVVIFVLLSFFSIYLYYQVGTLAAIQSDVFVNSYGVPYALSSINLSLLKEEEAAASFRDGVFSKETMRSEIKDFSKNIDDDFMLMERRLSAFENSRFFAGDKDSVILLEQNFSAVKSDYEGFKKQFDYLVNIVPNGNEAEFKKSLNEIDATRLALEKRINFLKNEVDNLTEKYSLIASGVSASLLRASFLFVAAMLVIAFGMSSNVVLPLIYFLEAILQGVKRFHSGKFDRPIILKSKNEFGMIAGSLNEAMVKLEESFKEARRLNLLVESSIEGIVITDTMGVIQYVNPAWEKLTGWKAEEVVKKVTPRIIKSGKQSLDFYEKLWKTIKDGKVFRSELVNKRKDRSFYCVDEVIMPLFGQDGKITAFAGFQDDITDKKQAENERIELKESRDAFIRNTAHGLRTPLSAIGYTFEIMMDKISELPVWTHQFLVGAREHYVWMRDILENFIFIQELNTDYFKRKDAQVSPRTELALITDHARWFAGSKNISFEWFAKDTPESLPVDRTAFLFVVKQLLDNAQIYTRPHGKIVISTFQEDKMFVMEVTDTGVGIPKDDQQFIFKPFFRGRNAYEMKNVGTGIGLYLIKIIAEGYGGNASFHSTEGKGSTFIIRLPLKERSG